jgi:hypothetical protein
MFTITPRALAAPTAALLAGSALAVSSAAGQDGRILTFDASAPVRSDTTQVDRKPRGFSLGDEYALAVSLRSDGRVVGRAHIRCVIIDRRYEGQDCDVVLVLRDGTLTASGGGLDRRLPGAPKDVDELTDEWAITGGTGAYAGASGTLATTSRRDDSAKMTVRF